jgi:hypothetical protein
MREMNFDQQDRIFRPELACPVIVMGAGAVGSQLVLALSRLGFDRITVWDADNIESHNIPMSAYRVGDLARPKVDALAELVREAMGYEIAANRQMYVGQTELKGLVVASVDTMEARWAIWSKCKNNPLVPLFVDTRVAEEFISVFAVQPCLPEDIAYYEYFWHPSKDTLVQMCGRHNAVHVSGIAALTACAALTEWLKSGTTQRHLKMLCGHLQVV